MNKSALIVGPYRYSLTRAWGTGTAKPCCFIMLNPSTADAITDDATIKKCIAFAKRWNFSGLEVVNLYAFRATNPKDLWKAEDPVGKLNDGFITEAVQRAGRVIVAWGAHARAPRIAQVGSILRRHKVKAEAFALTKNGSPKHPLYVKYETALTPFNY